MTTPRAAWALASLADFDTHLVQLEGGIAYSVCGLTFTPKALGANGDRLSLPGWPPDPEQVCPHCQKATGSGSRRP
jgi:hypothetical protein